MLDYPTVLIISCFILEGDLRGSNLVKLEQAPAITACFQSKCRLQYEARSEEHYKNPNIVLNHYIQGVFEHMTPN